MTEVTFQNLNNGQKDTVSTALAVEDVLAVDDRLHQPTEIALMVSIDVIVANGSVIIQADGVNTRNVFIALDSYKNEISRRERIKK